MNFKSYFNSLFTKVLIVSLFFILFAANCKEDEDQIDYFDHAGQAIIDNDSLVDFLKTHYLTAENEIDTLDNGQQSLFSQIDTLVVHRKWDYEDDEHDLEIDYNLYYIKLVEGVSSKPINVDSVNVSYKGMLLNNNVFDESIYGTWFDLSGSTLGFSKGVQLLKSGTPVVNNDQSLSYENVGKAIFFIPSGLAYYNETKSKIPKNSPLIFFVDLNLVKRNDNDRDGILSIFEYLYDSNSDKYTEIDTDEDGYYNYYDVDDDGDGTLTKNENPDPDGDGDPVDAKKTDGVTPDYLNPLVK